LTLFFLILFTHLHLIVFFLIISRLVRVTEPGGPLGLVSSQGWYISSDVARMHPELASYRGLMNSNLTNKIFQRPITFGEYCYTLKQNTNSIGTKWDNSFCRFFYTYHTKITAEACALNPDLSSITVDRAYHLCTFFVVTVTDLWEYSPSSASDLNIYSICPSCDKIMVNVDPLYSGHFVKLGTSASNIGVGTVAARTEYSTTKSSSIQHGAYHNLKINHFNRVGEEMGGYLLHSGCTTRGDPGGGKWNYDLPTMLQINEREELMEDIRTKNWTINEYLPLKLTPYDTGKYFNKKIGTIKKNLTKN
jgi:hypothetical protein